MESANNDCHYPLLRLVKSVVQVKTILKTLTASNRNDWDKVLGISTFSSIDLLSSTGLRICVLVVVYSTSIVQNELICGYASALHTLSSFHPHAHTLIVSNHLKTVKQWG